MALTPKIKNRIIQLTLYTNMSIKGILNIVSDEVPITIEEYCETLAEYEEKTGKKITKGNKNNEELKAIDDELLIDLCKRGWTNIVIMKYLLDNGYVISLNELKNRICAIHKDYNLEPKVLEKRRRRKQQRKCGISDEEIMVLFEKGVSFPDMARYFEKIGKKITAQRLNMVVHEIYESRGEKAPKRSKKVIKEPKKSQFKSVTEKDYKTILELREDNMSYEQMANYFKEKGYKISAGTIGKLCKSIYKEIGKEEPKLKKRVPSFINKKIFTLKEQGLTYKQIQEVLKEEGIEMSISSISSRCYNEYKHRNKPISGKHTKSKTLMLLKLITDKELEALTNQQYSYKRIAEYYNKKGVEVCSSYIQKRIEALRMKRKQEEEFQKRINIKSIDEKKFNNALISLKETKNATDMQLQEIANYYGFDYKSDFNKTSPYNVLEIKELER